MNLATTLWGWASRDPVARWGAGAGVIVLWTSVAWADIRILLALPIVAAVLFVLYHRRATGVTQRDDEFEDWF